MRTLVVCLCLLTAVALAQEPAHDPALKAAREWLSLLDAGSYDQAYEQSSSVMKESAGPEDIGMQAKTARTILGDMVSREFKSAQRADELAQGPKGDYWMLTFDTKFTKRTAEETVACRLEDGQWKVARYLYRGP